jgi:hypothetical protein
MKEYICAKCNKSFDKSSNYKDHLNRKTSCSPQIYKINHSKTAKNLLKNTENLLKNTENLLKFTEIQPKNKEIQPKNKEIQPKNKEIRPKNSKIQLEYIPNQVVQDDNINENNEILLKIDDENISCLNKNQCIYCNKKFTRKDNVKYHMKKSCKIKQEINKQREIIFEKLKLDQEEKEKYLYKIKKLENEKYEMKQLIDENKKYNEKIFKIISKLEKKIEKQAQIINNDNSFINNDNSQHLYLLNYNKEDLSKLDKKKVVASLNRGYQAPIEITKLIHFDEEHPEHHNIYIPKINEKYAMVFKDDVWRLMDKNVLVDDIFENKRDYIVENLEKFIKEIDPRKLEALKHFLNSEDYEIGIINTKEDIKKVLYENRRLAMDRRKEIENNKRKKKLDIIKLKK